MATNTNPHSPGNVDPAKYQYLGNFYQGDSEDLQDAYRGEHAHLTATLGQDWDDRAERHANGGCISCGSHYQHGALLRYTPTGQLVAVGHTCGETFGLPDKAARDRRRASERAAKLAEARKARQDMLDQFEAVPGLGWAMVQDHRIIRDMVARGRMLSDRQVAFALELADQVVDEVYERAANPETAPPADVPVPEVDGRVAVAGRVLSVKWQENDYGGSLKMLVEVETDGGVYRLFGSVPSAIDPEPGDSVTFTAAIERSRRDESFGFYKRPTKATITEGSNR